MKNLAVSIHAKLLKIARQTGREHGALLRLYAQERLLYRLSQVAKDHFILKGGLLLFSIGGLRARPTQDIDLMGTGQINDEALMQIFREVAAYPYDDGVVFEPDSVKVERIMEKGELDGRRVTLMGKLGLSTRLPMQIDIGYGDVVVPQPNLIEFPVFFEEFPAPELSCYSYESSVAEKFHAMVVKDVLNSRMKDFFDVWYYSTQRVFEGSLLQDAIAQTFERRKTDPDPEPWVFSTNCSADPLKATQWNVYLARIRTSPGLDFPGVVERVQRFISPAWAAICEGEQFNLFWNPDTLQWQGTRPVRREIATGSEEAGS